MEQPLTSPAASPLLALAGAVPAAVQDSGVAWHYGDPFAEQRLLASGAGVVDCSHRGVLRVSGPDRLPWLHALTTQHLEALPPGVSAEALVLDPKGRIEHALHLVDDGESSWITVEPGTAEALTAWLVSMRFLRKVEVEDVTADWAVLAGPGALQEEGATPPWVDPWPRVLPASVSYAAVDRLPGHGGPGSSGSSRPEGAGVHPGAGWMWSEVLVPRARLVDAVDPATLAGTWAAEAWRVAAWRPRLGLETDARTIPHELDWLRTAVHLSKGCYRGQETVARVHNLGRPPRRLVFLQLDGSGHGLPEHGDAVSWEGRGIGHVTTAARHHELGPVALALVKRSTPVEVPLMVGDVAAVQEVVVAAG